MGPVELSLGTGCDRNWSRLCEQLRSLCVSEVLYWIPEYGNFFNRLFKLQIYSVVKQIC